MSKFMTQVSDNIVMMKTYYINMQIIYMPHSVCLTELHSRACPNGIFTIQNRKPSDVSYIIIE